MQLVRSRHGWILFLFTSLSTTQDGLIIFKLERECPQSAVHQDTLYYILDKYMPVYDFNTGSDIRPLNMCKFGHTAKDLNKTNQVRFCTLDNPVYLTHVWTALHAPA
jgi:hypothetical protein